MAISDAALMIFSVVCLVAAFTLEKLIRKNGPVRWAIREICFNTRGTIHGLYSLFSGAVMKSSNKFDSFPDRKGCTAVVTGGSKGIGIHVVKGLAKSGMHIIVGVRKPDSCQDISEEIKKEHYAGSVVFAELDTSSLSSVRAFAERVKKDHREIHLLVNNAGVIDVPHQLTEDGFELQLATNYMGHFLLTHLLLDSLALAGMNGPECSRVINVSSCAHTISPIQYDDINFKESYHSLAAYGQSKLAQLMFSRHLDHDLQSSKTPVRSFALHPGIVDTQMTAKLKGQKNLTSLLLRLMKSSEEGATTVLYCCFSKDLESEREQFISDCRPYHSTKYSQNEQEQNKLFDFTNKLLGIRKFGVEDKK